MSPGRLEHDLDPSRFGGKAASLSAALRAGLPVPSGWAIDDTLASALAERDARASELCAELLDAAREHALAVRSSAVGEDSTDASFAGQHLTRLHVRGPGAVIDAVREVWLSGRSESALAYRRRLGLPDAVQMGVVVQRMAAPLSAGVMFTRDPVTGADERVIEVTWGLGEAVVSGLVTPDRYRMRRGGEVLERALGDKDLEIVPCEGGGTREQAVDPGRAARLCLGPDDLAALDELAERCDRWFGGPSDIEFAVEETGVLLLQRRAITR